MVKAALPRVYLGTMTFGWTQASSFVDTSIATAMLARFANFASDGSPLRVDTARIYAAGDTEPIVRDAISGAGVGAGAAVAANLARAAANGDE